MIHFSIFDHALSTNVAVEFFTIQGQATTRVLLTKVLLDLLGAFLDYKGITEWVERNALSLFPRDLLHLWQVNINRL